MLPRNIFFNLSFLDVFFIFYLAFIFSFYSLIFCWGGLLFFIHYFFIPLLPLCLFVYFFHLIFLFYLFYLFIYFFLLLLLMILLAVSLVSCFYFFIFFHFFLTFFIYFFYGRLPGHSFYSGICIEFIHGFCMTPMISYD